MPNKLSQENSPYLQEHANNPVDWHPWNAASLALAKETGKPILLSIGYSACHWCHVMAYESFEDPETAKLMNALFINIKVDREERPDLDKVYQLGHQLITQQSGGWPLTIFLTPDTQMPFFAGKYFPKEAKKNSPNFKQVLTYIAKIYEEKVDEIEQLGTEMQTAFSQLDRTKKNLNLPLTEEPIKKALDQLAKDFDTENGGFGETPKFPHPLQCNFLLNIHKSTHNTTALNMLEKTLDSMALGGIYDQLGGGFFRYSTDAEWEIPHFEKMLYDSALLLSTYCEAYSLLKKPLYKRIIQETADWLLNSMNAKSGGFYATLNADSGGMEGGYYLWDKQDCKNALSDKDYIAIKNYFNLDEAPNFECKWHLYVKQALSYNETITQAKKILLAERQKRLPPACDTKILCSWNALAIKALYQAGNALQEERYILAADRALDFICKHFFKNDKLLAASKDGTVYLDAYLDDYAFLLDALLEKLAQKPDDKVLLNFTERLADSLLKHFYDQENDAFFFTSDFHENIIHRPKVLLDDATPAGNSIAALAFWRLGEITNKESYKTIAVNTTKACWEYLDSYPAAHCSLLAVLQLLL